MDEENNEDYLDKINTDLSTFVESRPGFWGRVFVGLSLMTMGMRLAKTNKKMAFVVTATGMVVLASEALGDEMGLGDGFTNSRGYTVPAKSVGRPKGSSSRPNNPVGHRRGDIAGVDVGRLSPGPMGDFGGGGSKNVC